MMTWIKIVCVLSFALLFVRVVSAEAGGGRGLGRVTDGRDPSLEKAFFSRDVGRFIWLHCSACRVGCLALAYWGHAQPSAGSQRHDLYILPE
jgi:hypothetical protein